MSRYPALDRNLTVDVVVIGAGITGLTAAYLLKQSGLTVAVIDRRRCGGVDSGMTTAHVTCVTDLDLTELVKNFGRDHAQAVVGRRPGRHRPDRSIVGAKEIDCEWTLGAGLQAPARGGSDATADAQRLQEEARLAAELGFDARFIDAVPLFGHARHRISPARRSSIPGNTSPRSPAASMAAARTSSSIANRRRSATRRSASRRTGTP